MIPRPIPENLCSMPESKSVDRNIASQPPFVVIATNDLAREEKHHYQDMCRQVWQHNLGVTMALKDNVSLQLVSMGVGNESMETIAVILHTESSSAAYFDANTDDTENITCFLLSKRNPSPLVLNIAKTYKDPTTEPLMYSVQVSTLLTNHVRNTTEPNSYTIHVISSAVGALVASLFVGLLLKKCLQRTRNNIDPMRAHVWTLPHGRAGPGLFRSASLPDMTSACLTVPDDPASCRALIAILQHFYSEIPDNIAVAQRPLPALPHTYCEIPDHIAAAQRPLPALPPTYDEIPDNIAAQRPLSVPSHTYLEIPDLAVCSMARPAAFKKRLTASCRSLPGALYFMEASKRIIPPIGNESVTSMRAAAYGVPHKARNNLSRIPSIGHESGTSMRSAAYGVPGKARNNLSRIPSIGHESGTSRRAAAYVVPGMYSPWKITEKGSQIIAKSSFPALPNTYWPWSLPGEEPHNTQCQQPSVPFLPNTYSWKIPLGGDPCLTAGDPPTRGMSPGSYRYR
ncbi:hypothetical protein Bbelb_341480 [Branchiostoma belcheri]|nr:hypothetical protein Bbelb_341480 [Branchiostoma belcheri]